MARLAEEYLGFPYSGCLAPSLVSARCKLLCRSLRAAAFAVDHIIVAGVACHVVYWPRKQWVDVMVVVLSADVKLLTLGVVPFNAVTVMLLSSNAQLVGGVDLAICWQASRAARRLGLGSFWAWPRSLAFASGHALDKEWRAYESASIVGLPPAGCPIAGLMRLPWHAGLAASGDVLPATFLS